jgi:heat-inducible transcriptional repressor
MATLEDYGLLQHPHTSAGRLPSDAGYRFYVQELMEARALDAGEQRTIQHQFHQVECAMDEWLALARAVLAQTLHNAAVATPPLALHARVRRIELVPIHERAILVVLVLQSGHIRQQVVRTEVAVDRDELGRLSNRLSALLEGRSAISVRAAVANGSEFEQAILESAAHAMEQTQQQASEDVYYEGIRYMVAQPEFSLSAKLQPVVEALEHGNVLTPLLAEAATDTGVRIIIGREQPHAAMRECSAIVVGYGPDAELRGVVGVVGPTRMPYWRAVPLVRFVGELVDSLVRESYR